LILFILGSIIIPSSLLPNDDIIVFAAPVLISTIGGAAQITAVPTTPNMADMDGGDNMNTYHVPHKAISPNSGNMPTPSGIGNNASGHTYQFLNKDNTLTNTNHLLAFSFYR
jgi:hypothetical protein